MPRGASRLVVGVPVEGRVMRAADLWEWEELGHLGSVRHAVRKWRRARGELPRPAAPLRPAPLQRLVTAPRARGACVG